MDFFIGVDVGTASVRSGLYSLASKSFEKTAVQPITVHKSTINVKNSDRDTTETISQSSMEIWQAVCKTVKEVSVGVQPDRIRAIGFDATCSLVVVGPDDKPFKVDGVLRTEDKENSFLDVIMWQDHRAKRETDFINQTLAGDDCLKFVGGQVSLEMQIPKLLWLKTHQPVVFHQASRFMDLCDFLSWKATGDSSRSMCSVVCKWLYQVNPENPSEHYWDADVLSKIGLEELCQNNFRKIGSEIRISGGKSDLRISEKAAEELGLALGTTVATSLIDAHAGGLALSFCLSGEEGRGRHNLAAADRTRRLSLICGTSTCYMHCSHKPIFVAGVWGPYYSAMIPGFWLNEAGQSAAGQFLDHIVRTHPFYLTSLKSPDLSTCYMYLNQRAVEIQLERQLEDLAFLTEQLHVFPDFHGNRSPLSNPDIRGMIMGLTLDGESELSLIKLYLAAIQGLAYESRWIIECMQQHGITTTDIAICGGLANNPTFIKTLADVVGLPVMVPDIKESVMLGSAILAASAWGGLGTLEETASLMAGSGRVVGPVQLTEFYHKDRYQVFRKMADLQLNVLNSTLHG